MTALLIDCPFLLSRCGSPRVNMMNPAQQSFTVSASELGQEDIENDPSSSCTYSVLCHMPVKYGWIIDASDFSGGNISSVMIDLACKLYMFFP